MGRSNHRLSAKRAGKATRQDEWALRDSPYEARAKQLTGIRLSQAMSLSLLASIHSTKPMLLPSLRMEPNTPGVCSLAHLRRTRSDCIRPDAQDLTI
jgi:hypothetical protein